MYEVFLEHAAERDLKRLSAENYHRIVPHLKALARDPRPSDCRKLSGSKSDWRIRIGDYRVIDVGTVVHVYRKGEAFEVEFLTLDGETVSVTTVQASQVRPVSKQDITHARPRKIAV